MSKRDLDLLLNDILECCEKIKKYTNGYNFDDFMNDDKTIDAVVRNFTIIGEACSNVDPDYKTINPQIDWRSIKDLRNRMIHDYTGTNYKVVWEIIKEYIEELEFQIKELLN